MSTFRWPTGWDPFAGLRIMQKELERLSARGSEGRGIGGGMYPPVNVLSGPADIVVECEVPGVKKEDMDLSITGETLVVKGTKKADLEEDDGRYRRRERGVGDFSRTIVLPEKVDPERISASMAAGILTVRLPKSEAVIPKHIEVS